MKDLNHYFGNDISPSSTGDLLTVEGSEKTKQRILRRLLTNPGDYIFHPDYGAGVPRFIGDVFDAGKIKAVIRGQVLKESAVARQPAPEITVAEITGGIAVNIKYNDAATGTTQLLSFNVSV